MRHAIVNLGILFLILFWVARVFLKDRLWQAWLVMVLMTMIVDLDHLLANPIYDPYRCSLNFHPLHSFLAIFFYFVMAEIPKLRLIGFGLLIHMILDGLYCIWLKLMNP